MQIKIDLPPDLEQDLIHRAAQTQVSVQDVILQTLRQSMQSEVASEQQWPDIVLGYEGVPDFPAFEGYREELLAYPESK